MTLRRPVPRPAIDPTLPYWEQNDQSLFAYGRMRNLAPLSLGFSMSHPAWFPIHLLGIRRGRWLWHWTIVPNATTASRYRAHGRALTLGGAVWAALRASDA